MRTGLTTVTTAAGPWVNVGQAVTMSAPDRRKWPRLIAWLLRRPAPTRMVAMRVTAVYPPNECEVELAR